MPVGAPYGNKNAEMKKYFDSLIEKINQKPKYIIYSKKRIFKSNIDNELHR